MVVALTMSCVLSVFVCCPRPRHTVGRRTIGRRAAGRPRSWDGRRRLSLFARVLDCLWGRCSGGEATHDTPTHVSHGGGMGRGESDRVRAGALGAIPLLAEAHAFWRDPAPGQPHGGVRWACEPTPSSTRRRAREHENEEVLQLCDTTRCHFLRKHTAKSQRTRCQPTHSVLVPALRQTPRVVWVSAAPAQIPRFRVARS